MVSATCARPAFERAGLDPRTGRADSGQPGPHAQTQARRNEKSPATQKHRRGQRSGVSAATQPGCVCGVYMSSVKRWHGKTRDSRQADQFSPFSALTARSSARRSRPSDFQSRAARLASTRHCSRAVDPRKGVRGQRSGGRIGLPATAPLIPDDHSPPQRRLYIVPAKPSGRNPVPGVRPSRALRAVPRAPLGVRCAQRTSGGL
jgi:hypothetical protein